MTLKNNRVPFLSNIKLCASFHHHMWIQTGVTVRKQLSWVLTSVTLTFDLWPWPFAWTSHLSMVITPQNFRMIWWQEHCQKGVTDGLMDRQMERSVLRAALSHLKISTAPWQPFCLGLNVLTLLVLKLCWQNKPILCLLMPWIFALPWHQRPWHWLCGINKSLSSTRMDMN